MELKEHAKRLRRRANSGVGNVVAAYEVKKWPEGRVNLLVGMGVLRSLPDADEIRCPGCTERHMIVPLKTTLPNGEFYAEHLCSKEGLIPIPEFLFKQWEIVVKKHSAKKAATVKPKKLLNIRVANVLIKHQRADSADIAKMVDSTPGSVRTTDAWKMRKELQDKYGADLLWDVSDTFTANRKWVQSLVDAKPPGVKVRFQVASRC